MKQLFNKDAILLVLVAVIAFIFGLSKVIPQFNQLLTTRSKISDIKPRLQDMERTNTALMNKKKVKVKLNIPSNIYESPYQGLTLENASIELVDGIINLLKETNNNVWQISYEQINPNEPLASQKPDDCDLLKLNLKLNGTYSSFKNLLNRIYAWKYLTGVERVMIEPNQNNKRNLDINLQLILFVKH